MRAPLCLSEQLPNIALKIGVNWNVWIFILTKKALLLCINLSAFQKRVEIPYLVRVHRSYIINLHKIDAFETNYIHIDGKLIPLGAKYKNCFEKVFPYLGKAGIII